MDVTSKAKTITITDGDFDGQVLESPNPVLVDYWAAWCNPCKMLAPILDEIGSEQPALTIGKLDVDANPGAALRYGVQSLPTLILYKNGQEVERIIGFMPKERLLARLKPHLG